MKRLIILALIVVFAPRPGFAQDEKDNWRRENPEDIIMPLKDEMGDAYNCGQLHYHGKRNFARLNAIEAALKAQYKPETPVEIPEETGEIVAGACHIALSPQIQHERLRDFERKLVLWEDRLQIRSIAAPQNK